MTNKELIDESTSGEGFSSNVHTAERITYDNEVIDVPEFQIPGRYFSNKVRLLPVNTNTYYVYWEVTRSFTDSFGAGEISSFAFRVLGENNEVLQEFDATGEVGQHYIDAYYDNADILIQMGFKKDGQFFPMLTSNRLHTFSDQIKFADPHDEKWLTKEKNWLEIVKRSIHYRDGISSAEHHMEMENIKALSKIEEEKLEKGFDSFEQHVGGISSFDLSSFSQHKGNS